MGSSLESLIGSDITKNNLDKCKISNTTPLFFFFFLPSVCVFICSCFLCLGQEEGTGRGLTENSCYIMNRQDTREMHGTDNFKGVSQENK